MRAVQHLQGFGANLLSGFGIARLARSIIVRDGRFVLMFHGIQRRTWPGVNPFSQCGLTQDELQLVLEWLMGRFAVLEPGEFFGSDAPGVLLTFDDGLANNAANAIPVLEAFEAPAVFFVTTQHVEDPGNWLPFTRIKAQATWAMPDGVPCDVAADLFDGMSVDQLRDCVGHPLITIGAHSVSHAFLSRCTDSELHDEVVGSRKYLENVTGASVDLFAYPTGDYDHRVVKAVEEAGYRFSFAVDSKGVGKREFEIPRIGLYGADAAYLDLKLSGLHRRPIQGRPWLRGGD